jgi:glutamate-1-semialdehyde 2,1-aminomutase
LSKSKKLFNNAKRLIPSGVNSPVRYFAPYPFFVKKAQGSSVWDVDGRRYVDFCNGYGALLLGHGYKDVISAVKRQIANGTLYGAPTQHEVDLAELILQAYPSMKKVRLVNTGSEATMTAIRLARGFTKKKKIIKFEGCYHGAHDSMLVKAGSGAAHSGIAVSDGVPSEFTKNTIVTQYNDIEQLEYMIKKNDDVAGVIVEPVLGNMGLILPQNDFLSKMRKITKRNGIQLIFDETITGFRMSIGGAQKYFGITPDITTLGKALGNGFVISAVGGRKEIMDQLAPQGKVYEASTFAGNPLSAVAAKHTILTLKKLEGRLYSRLEKYCQNMVGVIGDAANDMKIPHQINSIASMFQIFFTSKPVTNYTSSKKSDTKKFHKFFHHLLKQGVFIPPSQFETAFLSYSHTSDDLTKTAEAYVHALKMVRR